MFPTRYIQLYLRILLFAQIPSKLSFCIPHNIRIKKKKPWTVRYRLDAGRKAAGDIYRLLSRIARLNVHILFRFDHISDYGIQKKNTEKIYRIFEGKNDRKKKSVDGTGWDVLVKNVSPGYTKLLTICCSLKMKRRPKIGLADTGWQDF